VLSAFRLVENKTIVLFPRSTVDISNHFWPASIFVSLPGAMQIR
jgi:hypothetical protein